MDKRGFGDVNIFQTVSKEVTVGFFVGAFCLSGVLYFLLKTEEKIEAGYYTGSVLQAQTTGDQFK